MPIETVYRLRVDFRSPSNTSTQEDNHFLDSVYSCSGASDEFLTDLANMYIEAEFSSKNRALDCERELKQVIKSFNYELI